MKCGASKFLCRTAALAFAPICFVHLEWQGIKADTPGYQELMSSLPISKPHG